LSYLGSKAGRELVDSKLLRRAFALRSPDEKVTAIIASIPTLSGVSGNFTSLHSIRPIQFVARSLAA